MRDLMNLVENLVGRFYHVTEAEYAADIIENGFLGGWGDVGFGVYLYDNMYDAQSYMAKGGWDEGLEHPVILVIQDHAVERVPVLSSEWDASLYDNMWWHDMDDLDEDTRWVPASVALVKG